MSSLLNIDLNHSRPLDVHRWSDYPEINTLVERIYSSLPPFLETKISGRSISSFSFLTSIWLGALIPTLS